MEKQVMKNKKNILIIIFIAIAMYFILSFNEHNFKRAIDACIAGSKKLDKPMTTQQAKEFCEDQINKDK